MGYFAYAYVVEGAADNHGVTLTTSVYGGPLDRRVLFSWGEGDRSPGLHSYAGGTLCCEAVLGQLPGYPRTQRLGARPGENSDTVLIEEGFTPPNEAEPVLFHFVLPTRFIPGRSRNPMIVPKDPSVIRRGDRLTATFATKGGGKLRFWILRLPENESFDNYDLGNIFNAPSADTAKVSFEVNLGIVKLGLGNR